MKTVRCAIYTRKSSEEGLEQSFNSLDAQREACSAYILSQASEGWAKVAEQYDDGGLSGGTLERPALQRLLGDIAAGRIDIIVVYKVDRLTRSLLDFAKLVEAFDKAGVSFVSITQSFNTTTSMGRLTLNMLLSFAQFEREVTAERIRDKIAASKARGMWMGGVPPLRYRPEGRTLAIVEEHAALVRDIFRRYLALGSVRLVAQALSRERILTPPRVRANGHAFGGVAFTRGQLYAILRNPIYVGEIPHRGATHPGLHPGIIAREMFDRAARLLAEHLQGERRATLPDRSPLAGRIVDESGAPLVAAHASKTSPSTGKRIRYRYYVSRALQHGGDAAAQEGCRMPAREIERLVADQLACLLDEPAALTRRLEVALDTRDLHAPADRCRVLAARLRLRSPEHLDQLVHKVRVHASTVEIDLEAAALLALLDISVDTKSNAAATITLSCPARLTRTGRALRLIADEWARPAREPAPTLLRLLVQARSWWAVLTEGTLTIGALAAREQVSPAWITRVVRLAFLSPALTRAILDGKQNLDLDRGTLLAPGAVPSLWREQEALYG